LVLEFGERIQENKIYRRNTSKQGFPTGLKEVT
jgi:hypothetical protein